MEGGYLPSSTPEMYKPECAHTFEDRQADHTPWQKVTYHQVPGNHESNDVRKIPALKRGAEAELHYMQTMMCSAESQCRPLVCARLTMAFRYLIVLVVFAFFAAVLLAPAAAAARLRGALDPSAASPATTSSSSS